MEKLKFCIERQRESLNSLIDNFLNPLRVTIAATDPKLVTLAAHARQFRLEHLLRSAKDVVASEENLLSWMKGLNESHVQPLREIVASTLAVIEKETNNMHHAWTLITGQTPFDEQMEELLGKALEIRIIALHYAVENIIEALRNLSKFVFNHRHALSDMRLPIQLTDSELGLMKVKLPLKYIQAVSAMTRHLSEEAIV